MQIGGFNVTDIDLSLRKTCITENKYSFSNSQTISNFKDLVFKTEKHIKTFGSCFNINSQDENSDYACAKLCALMKSQLVKVLQDINQRYCEACNLSDIVINEVNAQNLEMAMINHKHNLTNENEQFSKLVSTSVPLDNFLILESVQDTHKYHLTLFQPTNPQQFYKTVSREYELLKTSLPPGVWVRLYEDRIDLLSVMIAGAESTPYEDGVFLFDILLGNEYPSKPPMCHYISYCIDRLNPNLYEDGKVCISLLGTWTGRGSEVWTIDSTLLQLIISIQGLILVAEPYFNEAGYEKQKGKFK